MDLLFEVTSGPLMGQWRLLRPGDVCEAGRGEGTHLAIPGDPQVSGRHFVLEFNRDKWNVRDLQSTNGTFVNGRRIFEAGLTDGDEIGAGQTNFRVRIQAPAEQPASEDSAAQDPVAKPTVVAGELPIIEPAAEYAAPLLNLVNETSLVAGTLLWEAPSGEAYLTVIVKATFTVDQNGDVELAAEQLPIFQQDFLEDPKDPTSPARFESDMVPFKPRADVVLVGRARAPGGRPVKHVDVRLRAGSAEKSIRVFGDRKWSFPSRLTLAPRIIGPDPFQKMELTYRRAFGGIDAAAARYCPENLAGVGFIGDCSPESVHNKPLPNLEDPHNLITAWDSHPTPVGFGFYGRGWMPRLKYAGTYDEKYRQLRAPLAPEDFSFELCNGAHPDLQVDGYLQCGQPVELDNVHPDGPIRFCLPLLRPQISITRVERTGPASSAGQELKTSPPATPVLDTLILIPDHRTFVEVFRYAVPVASLDQIDVYTIAITQTNS